MSTTPTTTLWRWTRRITRAWLVAFSLTLSAAVLYLLGLTTAAGLTVWLGGLGLIFTTWTLMMLSTARAYLAGQWPLLDAERDVSVFGNPALYRWYGQVIRFFGQVFRHMFRL